MIKDLFDISGPGPSIVVFFMLFLLVIATSLMHFKNQRGSSIIGLYQLQNIQVLLETKCPDMAPALAASAQDRITVSEYKLFLEQCTSSAEDAVTRKLMENGK